MCIKYYMVQSTTSRSNKRAWFRAKFPTLRKYISQVMKNNMTLTQENGKNKINQLELRALAKIIIFLMIESSIAVNNYNMIKI